MIVSYLDDIASELRAVDQLLVPELNRFAAFHLQQAAEKIAKVVRLAHGLQATKEHRLEVLMAELPEGEPWRQLLKPHERLSAYATAYRYPSPTGRRDPGPGIDAIRTTRGQLAELLERARREFGS